MELTLRQKKRRRFDIIMSRIVSGESDFSSFVNFTGLTSAQLQIMELVINGKIDREEELYLFGVFNNGTILYYYWKHDCRKSIVDHMPHIKLTETGLMRCMRIEYTLFNWSFKVNGMKYVIDLIKCNFEKKCHVLLALTAALFSINEYKQANKIHKLLYGKKLLKGYKEKAFGYCDWCRKYDKLKHCKKCGDFRVCSFWCWKKGWNTIHRYWCGW